MSDDSKKYTLTLDSDGGFGKDGMPLFERRKVEYDKPVGTLPRPRKVGFRFNGWFRRLPSLAKNELVDDMKYPSKRDLTYMAQWTPQGTCRIDWFDGRRKVDTWTKTIGSFYGNLPKAQRTGYNLVGWYSNPDGSGRQALETTKVENTLPKSWYAKWETQVHSIRFSDPQFEMKFPDAQVEHGQTIGELPQPTTIGYKFVGWFLGDTKVEPEWRPIEDATLMARWEIWEYGITWNTVGKAKVPETEDYPRKYNMDSPDIVPPPLEQTDVERGYCFKAWVPESIPHGSTGDKVVSAVFEDVPESEFTYILMFDPNGGTVEENKKEVVQWDPVGELPTPTQEGHVFLGWFMPDNTQLHPDTKYTWNEHMTAKAMWRPNQYTVVYDGNLADTGYMPPETHQWGEWFELPKNTYARKFTVTFNWNDGTIFKDGTPIPSAQQSGMWYSGTVDDDGNPVDRPDITQVMVEDMKFAGWSRSPVDVVDEHLDSERVVNLASEDGAVVTLYAMWETDFLEMPIASRQGYIFLGWSFERQEDFPHVGYNTKDIVKALRIGRTVGPINNDDPIADRENYLIWKPCTHRRLNKQYEISAMWYPIVPTVPSAPVQRGLSKSEPTTKDPGSDATLYAMWYGIPTPYVTITLDDNLENLDIGDDGDESRQSRNVDFQKFINILETN